MCRHVQQVLSRGRSPPGGSAGHLQAGRGSPGRRAAAARAGRPPASASAGQGVAASSRAACRAAACYPGAGQHQPSYTRACSRARAARQARAEEPQPLLLLQQARGPYRLQVPLRVHLLRHPPPSRGARVQLRLQDHAAAAAGPEQPPHISRQAPAQSVSHQRQSPSAPAARQRGCPGTTHAQPQPGSCLQDVAMMLGTACPDDTSCHVYVGQRGQRGRREHVCL